jgi:hypothetical protein
MTGIGGTRHGRLRYIFDPTTPGDSVFGHLLWDSYLGRGKLQSVFFFETE